MITGKEPVLIDCGGANGYPALKRNLGELGVQPQDIAKVIATHGHWDHVSGFAQLAQESSAELWIHQADREQVEQGDYDRTGAFILMTFGHLPPTLVYDAKTKVVEARKQLGVYFNPWFKPMYETFQY